MVSRNELRISVAGSGGLTGVPKHSDLEPHSFLADGNANSKILAVRDDTNHY